LDDRSGNVGAVADQAGQRGRAGRWTRPELADRHYRRLGGHTWSRHGRYSVLRGEGVIGDEAFHRLEEELDFLDLALATQPYN
jgi:hypothetical protein